MTADRATLAALVIEAVATTFRVADPATITAATTASDVDGWDSLSHTMLLVKLETVLGRRLPLADIYAAQNVGELIDAVAASPPVERSRTAPAT